MTTSPQLEVRRRPDALTRRVEHQSGLPGSVSTVLRTSGEPLDRATRARLEPRLGHDFSHVRLHAGTGAARSARDLDAAAYAVAQHVVVDPGAAPSDTAGRDRLLAHELVHTLQVPTSAGPGPAAARVSEADSPAEREAGRLGGTARPVAGPGPGPAPAGTVHRQPAGHDEPDSTPGDVGVGLTITTDGKLEATVSGPKTPLGKPRLGLRRLPDGRYSLLLGADDTVLAAEEIPAKLRSIVKSAESGGKPRSEQLVVPTCDQLRRPGGRGWHTFEEYKVSAMLVSSAEPLSRPFFDLLLRLCRVERPKPSVIDVPPVPPPQEAVPPLVPEGEAIA